MKQTKKGRKSLRESLFSALTAVFILLVFAINYIYKDFTREKGLYVDLTPEGIYSLTDAMIRECSFIDKLDSDDREVKLIFCADRDTLTADETIRPTYFMALQLAERFDNLSVEVVNPIYDPTSVSAFEPTSLSKVELGDIIVSYGGRYRIQKPRSFWAGNGETLTHYNGEYTMASCIMSVTAKDRPAAYFITNHGETYYDAANPSREENYNAQALYDLITGRGLEVKTLDLSQVSSIPDDCVLLVINNPREDFKIEADKLSDINYVSETEMLDRYMVNNQGSIIVARDHAAGDGLHNLDVFLRDWGFIFTDTVVEDKDHYLGDTLSTVYGEYSSDQENSFGASVYSDFAALPSAAGVVFKDAGYMETSYDRGNEYVEAGNLSMRFFMSFMDSYDSAVARVKSEEYPENGYVEADKDGSLTLAAITVRSNIDSYTNVTTYSKLFCVNSANFFSNDVLGDYSFANREVMSLLLEEMLFTGKYASNELGGTSANFENYGGKKLADISLNVTSKQQIELNVIPFVLFAVPVGVLILGTVIYTKRKYL